MGNGSDTASGVKSSAAIRPAVFVSKDDIDCYGVPLRHLMVGLADQSSPAALVCPIDSQYNSVLCPSVEFVNHPLFKIPVFVTQNRMEVMDKLSKFKPTILHCFSPEKAKVTSYVSEQLSLPYVVSVNSVKKCYSKSFLCGGNCAGVIGSSGEVVEKLKSQYPNCKSSIEQVNMGAFVEDEVSCFADSSRITSMVLAQELTSVSELESLLNAIRHLGIDGYEFLLAIIGQGHASKKNRALIKSLGLGNLVTFVSEIKPMRSVFSGADIFLQLDVGDCVGSNLLEAMSVGMAVAASNHNKSELIMEDQTAVLFDPHDELSIYTCLKRLICKHEFARQLAANAQGQVKIKHSVSKMTNGIIEVYKQSQSRFKIAKSNGATINQRPDDSIQRSC